MNIGIACPECQEWSTIFDEIIASLKKTKDKGIGGR
jgi:hypothetical protein